MKDSYKIDNTEVRNFKLELGLAAETSGGLLACLPSENVDGFIRDMRE